MSKKNSQIGFNKKMGNQPTNLSTTGTSQSSNLASQASPYPSADASTTAGQGTTTSNNTAQTTAPVNPSQSTCFITDQNLASIFTNNPLVTNNWQFPQNAQQLLGTFANSQNTQLYVQI